MIKYMNLSDTTDLSNYFSSFVKVIVKQPVKTSALFFSILKKNLILLTIIVAFGLTIFGTPIILIVDLIKGFTLGYTFSFILTAFSGKGFWLAIAAVLPQNIVYLPCFIALSIISIEFSSNKLRSRFFNKGKVNTILERELILKVGVFLCIFILGALIETYICPNLIKFIVTKVYKVV